MIPDHFEYLRPETLDEAMHLLRTTEDAKIMAGGHSLVPLLKLRLSSPGCVIDMGRIRELAYIIRQEGDFIRIGALTTHGEVERSSLLKECVPLLPEVASQIGHLQIRNRGTIGGSLAYAHPAADYPAAMVALDAEIVIRGPSGHRTAAAADFLVGALQCDLAPDEILVAVRIPLSRQRSGATYLKMPHKASSLPIVGVAAIVTPGAGGICECVRIGITGVAVKAYRAVTVEAMLAGKRLDRETVQAASKHAADGIHPLSDLHVSAEYHAHLAQVYTARAILEASRRVQAH